MTTNEGLDIPPNLIVSRDDAVGMVDPLDWLANCKEAASQSVPKELFDSLQPELWTYLPWGHKIVVLRIPPDTHYGGMIVIPDAHRQQNASGWVLSVGVDICIPMDARYPSVCPHPHPLNLVGCKVNFGAFVGSPIRFSGLDSDYGQEPSTIKVIEMTIGDVHGEVLDGGSEEQLEFEFSEEVGDD